MSPTTNNIEVPSQAVMTTLAELKEIRRIAYIEGYEQAKKELFLEIKKLTPFKGMTFTN